MGLTSSGIELQSAHDTCLTLAQPSRTKHCQDGFNAIGDEPAESRSVATVKDASLTNPLTSDARSVMLRIPLPEDDGFALALPEKPRGGGRIQTGVSEA